LEDLRYGVYTLEKAVGTTRGSIERLATTRLCVLVPGSESETEFARFIQELVVAGVGAIQLREKSLADHELVGRARKLSELTRGTATFAIVNDRPDIAALVAADGVHLGQEDLSVKDARSIVGPRMLIGISTHNIDQARQAVLDGANYIGAGPTFPSTTKKFDNFAGLEFLREVAAEIRLPTFAIGGIDAQNLPEVLATGIARVAVSGSIAQAANPAFAARTLLCMLNNPVAEATSS
jgi:thiamine-phosphate pyrophosphorylase